MALFFSQKSARIAPRSLTVGLLSGVVIGAAAGLLLAPQTGAQCRSQIAKATLKGRRRAMEMSAYAAETARHASNRLHRWTTDSLLPALVRSARR